MRTFSNSKCRQRYEKILQEEQSSSEAENRQCNNCNSGTSIYIIGIGPGSDKYLTLRAVEALKEVDTVVAYKNYFKYVANYLEGKEIYSSGMKQEIERGRQAIEFALQKKKVAVISTGDAGIYGMAGLIIELLEKENLINKINIEIIPGVSAFNAAASIIGAPIMHDFAVISLSDLLTDWELIKKRLELASMGDFVISIYNPKSKKRAEQIVTAQKIMLKYKNEETPVAIVRNALREDQSFVLTDLKNFLNHKIDMLSIIIIGNSQSRIIENLYFLTPRGYHKKFKN